MHMRTRIAVAASALAAVALATALAAASQPAALASASVPRTTRTDHASAQRRRAECVCAWRRRWDACCGTALYGAGVVAWQGDGRER